MIKKPLVPSDKAAMRIAEDDSTIVVNEQEQLRGLFQKSPEKGFALLFRKYYQNLCSHSIRFVHSREVAEDIVSEVFTTFWQKNLHESVQSSYRAYLYQSVRFRSYNYLKSVFSNQDESVDIVKEHTLSIVTKPDEILLYQELSHKLDNIIKSLPPRSRRAFQLSRLEGRKYAEIAKDLGITVSAVERLISRALSKIRTEMKLYTLLPFIQIFL